MSPLVKVYLMNTKDVLGCTDSFRRWITIGIRIERNQQLEQQQNQGFSNETARSLYNMPNTLHCLTFKLMAWILTGHLCVMPMASTLFK